MPCNPELKARILEERKIEKSNVERRLTSGIVMAVTENTRACWNDRYCSHADGTDRGIRKTHIAAHSEPFPDITIGSDSKNEGRETPFLTRWDPSH